MQVRLPRLLKPTPPRLAVAAKLVPRFRRWKLTAADDVFQLNGEIVSGHADRHVVRVKLGAGPSAMTAYLKRELRVRLRDRLGSWLRGFGWVSLSEREGQQLAELKRLGIPVPRVLAHGTSGGRAFLLLRAATGAVDLRRFLHQVGAALPDPRRAAAARRLGAILGALHGAGYAAPDLLSKHVLIHSQTLQYTLLDWSRSRLHRYITPRLAAQDLGRLNASLADALATPRDRLRCLHAYWKARRDSDFTSFRALVTAANQSAKAALGRRSVRELRRTPVDEARQQLRWLDGERLCVTHQFWKACRGRVPGWLTACASDRGGPRRCESVLWRERHLYLRQWPAAPWIIRAWARLVGRRVETRDTRLAGTLFRLERYRIGCPRVLAFGRRRDGAGFLLTRPVQRLAGGASAKPLVQIGAMLRRLHAAGVRLRRRVEALGVTANGRPVVIDPEALRPMPRPAGRWPFRDLAMTINAMRLSADDAAQMVRGYLGRRVAEREASEVARALHGGLPDRRGSGDA